MKSAIEINRFSLDSLESSAIRDDMADVIEQAVARLQAEHGWLGFRFSSAAKEVTHEVTNLCRAKIGKASLEAQTQRATLAKTFNETAYIAAQTHRLVVQTDNENLQAGLDREKSREEILRMREERKRIALDAAIARMNAVLQVFQASGVTYEIIEGNGHIYAAIGTSFVELMRSTPLEDSNPLGIGPGDPNHVHEDPISD